MEQGTKEQARMSKQRRPLHRPRLPTPVVGIIGHHLNASTLLPPLVDHISASLTWKHLGRRKEGADCQDQVEGTQQESLEPGGFPVQADERVESGHQAKHRHF